MASNPDCTLCPLHDGAATVCVPTLHASGPQSGPVAIICVGPHPDAVADKAGRPFAGNSENTLNRWTAALQVREPELAIYHTHAVRCGPGPESRKSIQKVCVPNYLTPEIGEIAKKYDRILIWALGAPAAAAVSGWFPPNRELKLREISRTVYHSHENIWITGTYHPALLDRSWILEVAENCGLIERWLSGEEQARYPDIQLIPVRPWAGAQVISIDIENHHFIRGLPRSSSTQARLARADLPNSEELVQSCAITIMRGPLPTTLQELAQMTVAETMVFWPAYDADHFEMVTEYLRNSSVFVGMNLGFDLDWLDAAGLFPGSLLPTKQIIDISVLNAMENDIRLARSLKSLGHRLLGYDDWSLESEVDPGSDEANLYNARDTHVTAELAILLARRIIDATSGHTTNVLDFNARGTAI